MSQTSMEQRYRRAERLSQLPVTQEVLNTQVVAHWLPNSNRFWYERKTRSGREFVLIDAEARTSTPAFDHEALANALRAVAGSDLGELRSDALPLQRVTMCGDPLEVDFTTAGVRWKFDSSSRTCRQTSEAVHRPDWCMSPNGKRAAFVRDWDLWVHELETGREFRLTQDGERYFAYGLDADGHARFAHMPSPPKKPNLVWSEDGHALFVARVDDRKVLPVPVIEYVPLTGAQRPLAHSIRWASPGDEHIPAVHFVVIDLESRDVTKVQYPPVCMVRMLDTLFDVGLAWFGRDNRHAYFVDVERGERCAHVVEVDTQNGQTRVVFSENADCYLELGPLVYARTNVYYLRSSHELIWQSDRSGHAHLYRYDLETGELRNAITSGSFRVRDVIHVDESRGEVWFTASDLPGMSDPYFRHLCRVNVNGSDFHILTVGDADHDVLSQADFGLFIMQLFGACIDDISGVSPDSQFFVESFGTIESPTISQVRNRLGEVVMDLELADFDAALDIWRWPERFSAVADDGATLLHGVMVKPSDFSPAHRYPVVDLIYGGPQVSYVPKAALRGFQEQLNLTDALSLAELGCIVVILDGRGTAMRDRSFQNHSYGRAQRASDIDDHVAAIRELAKRHPFIDLSRVGITGISAGGYATAHAMLTHPAFFKVGVASSGNYDLRFFPHGWGERYHGFVDDDKYASQTLLSMAGQLQGKLLFTHGLLDHGCHPAALFQLTEALAAANCDFDLILDPKGGHDRSSYVARRIWDYFVKHLIGDVPPRGVSITHGLNLLLAR